MALLARKASGAFEKRARPWDLFLESPGNFSGPESHNKILNLTITELFYSHILNMNRRSFYTRSFRRIIYASPFLDTAELKIALRKVSWAFEKRAILNYQKPYHWLMHAIRRPTRDFLGRFYYS